MYTYTRCLSTAVLPPMIPSIRPSDCLIRPPPLRNSGVLGLRTRPCSKCLERANGLLSQHMSFVCKGNTEHITFMNERKKSGVRGLPNVVIPLFLPWVEKGKSSGENHDERTLDQRVESRVNHLSERTLDQGWGGHVNERSGAN